VRNAFSDALVAAATEMTRHVDTPEEMANHLAFLQIDACAPQYINCGVAEQNMVGMAAGLAKAGFRPVVYGLAAFVPVRVVEQIKIDVCYEQLPVIFTGDGAGLVYSTLGSSHQSFEDIACLRAVPHIEIMSPCDAHELTACMRMALAEPGPVYLRMGKADVGPVHGTLLQLRRGQLVQVRDGRHPVALVATGSMVKAACAIGNEIDASVWSAPWIKPLDVDQLAALAADAKALVTLEEHSTVGGLGGAVVEALCETAPIPVLRVGIGERFSQTCGSYAHAMREHGLDPKPVRDKVLAFTSRWEAA